MKTLIIILIALLLGSCAAQKQELSDVNLLYKSDIKQCYNVSNKQIDELVKDSTLTVHYVRRFDDREKMYTITKPNEMPLQIAWVEQN